MSTAGTVALRLTIKDPIRGVAYSLQNGKNKPVGPVFAGDGPLSFEMPVRVARGPKFLGDFVRREGASRQFVYVAIGEQAGKSLSEWNQRGKADIHLLPA